MMKQVLCVLSCLLLAGFALAQEGEPAQAEGTRSPEALEILKKADAAIKAVQSVKCEVTTEPKGVATDFRSPATGTSVLVGWTGSMPEKFYAHITTSGPDGESMELTGGGNGDTYFLVDHGTKKGYEDMDPGVMGSGARALNGVAMLEFVHDAPFDDELNADSVELKEEVAVNGEDCYQVHVKYAGGRGESLWFFSKKDYLPRRRVQLFNFQGQDGSLEITLSKLEVNVAPGDDLFRMNLPDGYEQIDDFAP